LLWPFCLAAATTVPEKLDGNSLVNRFKHRWRLVPYEVHELVYIINRFYLKSRVTCSYIAMREMARRGQGVPRLALNYAQKALDYAHSESRNEIKMADVRKALQDLGIDGVGLDLLQQNYLKILRKEGKPIGKDALAQMLGVSSGQLEHVIEPFLWRQRFISSSNRGRELTATGNAYTEGEKVQKNLLTF